jgi:hypothetical protein
VRRGWGGFRGWGLVLFCFGELIFLFVGFWGEGEGRGRKRESESVNVGGLGLRIFLRWRGRLLIRSWAIEGLVRVI